MMTIKPKVYKDEQPKCHECGGSGLRGSIGGPFVVIKHSGIYGEKKRYKHFNTWEEALKELRGDYYTQFDTITDRFERRLISKKELLKDGDDNDG